MRTAEQKRRLDQLEAELDNFRAALAWSLSEAGDVEEELQLASALSDFWEVRGYLREGRAWLADGLALEGTIGPAVRARALEEVGWLTLFTGETAAARPAFEASLLLSRTIRYTWCTGWDLKGLGNIAVKGRDYDTAQAMYTESLALFRQLGDKDGMAYLLLAMGGLAMAQGDYNQAQSRLVEGRAVFRQSGDPRGIAETSLQLGTLARTQGDDFQAAAFYDESLALFSELGSKPTSHSYTSISLSWRAIRAMMCGLKRT